MFEFQKIKESVEQTSSVVVQALPSTMKLMAAPNKFHAQHPRKKRPRSSALCGVLVSVVLAWMYHINVKSVSEVNASLLEFVTFGAAINFLHLVVIGLIYAGAGKMLLKKVPATTYIENVFFAAVLLPFIAFLAQPVANAQLEAIVADPSNFQFGYRTLYNQTAGHSSLVRWGEVAIGIAYLYFAYIIYVGLRIAKQVSRWRSILAVSVGTAGLFVYQSLCILPVTQVFVHAMTRG